VAAALAAAAATLLPQLLAYLAALGDRDAAVAIGIETLEALQRTGAELRKGDGAAIGELAATLTAIGLALGTLLRALLRGHRLHACPTLGAALRALRKPPSPLSEALLGAGALLRGKLSDTSLTTGLPLRLLLLAAGAHLLASEAAIAVRIEASKARFGTGNCLVAGHFGTATALCRLRVRGTGGGEQGTGDKAELHGFHG
jgi:hypothetical protein